MRARQLCIALAFFAAAPAVAQYQAPPTIPLQDTNGVDVRTGFFAYQNEDISVGQGAFPERLSVVRYKSSNPAFGYVGNFSAGTTHSLDFRVYRSTSGGVTSVYVMRGMLTDVFTQTAPNTYTGSNISGATLAGDSSSGDEYLNYTLRDGSVIRFQPTDFATCSYTSSSFTVCGMAQSWTFPSGAQITFTYGQYRVPGVFFQFVQALALVRNNFGYQLGFLNAFNSGQAAPVIQSITASNMAYSGSGRSVSYTYALPGPTLTDLHGCPGEGHNLHLQRELSAFRNNPADSVRSDEDDRLRGERDYEQCKSERRRDMELFHWRCRFHDHGSARACGDVPHEWSGDAGVGEGRARSTNVFRL